MIRFHDQKDYFELELTMQEVGGTPAEGDAYMTVKIDSAGFRGHNDLWVDARALRRFCTDLLHLAAKRRGSAKIEGMSPNEMEIVVRSIDYSGHMVVEGTTGYEVQREHGTRRHSVTFGFEFDPSQLNEVERVSWLTHNAEQDGGGESASRSEPK